MGMLDPNALIGFLKGKFGNLVFAQTKDGRVIVRHRPERKAEFTGPELANQSRFHKAAEYVRKSHLDPHVYAVYQRAARLTASAPATWRIRTFRMRR